MDVTIDSLFARIGKLSVETELLRAQLVAKDELLAQVDAEVTRLKAENEGLRGFVPRCPEPLKG